jgi:hypothetical protein
MGPPAATNSGSDALTDVEEVSLNGGAADNTFTVSGWTAGGVTLDGAGGTDRVVSANDADFTLADTALSRSAGGSFVLASIEQAGLTGGAGGNRFVVSAWTGSATLDGGLGLARGGAAPISFSEIEQAVLTGGPGANRFVVSDWAAPATLDGAAGRDRVVAANDTDFTLSDGSPARAGAPALTLLNFTGN